MRVAFFPHVPHYTSGLSAALRRMGVDVQVVPEPRPLVDPSGEFLSLFSRTALLPSRFSDIFKKARQLERFDVVHTQGALSSTAALMARRLYDVPFVMTSHGFPQPFGYKITATLLYEFADFISIGYVAKRASAVVTVSHHTQAALRRIHAIKAGVIYYGVDQAMFNPQVDGRPLREEFGIREDEKLVLWASRIIPIKDPLSFVRASRLALRALSKVKFLMVGDGPLHNTVAKESSDLVSSGKLILAKTVPFREMANYYAASDLFVYTSSSREGLPLAPIEAMACGKPVVLCRAGPFPEIAENNGFYFEPGNVKQLAETITRALVETDRTKEVALRGCERVRSKFSWAQAAERYLSLYRNCANR